MQDENKEPKKEDVGDSDLQNYLLYTLSLPERTVRSVVGLAAGAARETAFMIVPQAFQSSKTYEIVIKNSLGFLAEDIGGVQKEKSEDGEEGESSTDDSYMARKTVGNFVDLAGLATLHVSPVWFMAILSDVAYGSKSYVQELAKELESQGLIDDTSTIHHVDDVLEAVQNASGKSASMFDTPPLSVDQLRKSLNETREAINSADITNLMPESEMTAYWNEIREISDKEDISLLGVSGTITMHSLNKLGTFTKGTITGVQVAGGLFNQHVIGHYVESLAAVRDEGLFNVLDRTSTPYIEAVWTNFSGHKETFTETIFNGKLFSKIGGWFSGKKNDEELPANKTAPEVTSKATNPETTQPEAATLPEETKQE